MSLYACRKFHRCPNTNYKLSALNSRERVRGFGNSQWFPKNLAISKLVVSIPVLVKLALTDGPLELSVWDVKFSTLFSSCLRVPMLSNWHWNWMAVNFRDEESGWRGHWRKVRTKEPKEGPARARPLRENAIREGLGLPRNFLASRGHPRFTPPSVASRWTQM